MNESKISYARERILESRHKDLENLVNEEMKELLPKLVKCILASEGKVENNLYSKSLEGCRALAQDMAGIVSVISVFGKRKQHKELLGSLFTKLIEKASPYKEQRIGQEMYWYTVCFVFWVAGISAIEKNNYEMLAALFYAPVQRKDDFLENQMQQNQRLLESIAEGLALLHGATVFQSPSCSPILDRSNHFLEEFHPICGILRRQISLSSVFSPDHYTHLFGELEVLLAVAYRMLGGSNHLAIFGGRFSHKVAAGEAIHLSGLLGAITKGLEQDG